MEEVFKSLDFLGYPNYSVSNLGRIYNCKKNTYLKPGTNKQGYYQVSLSNKRSRVFGLHRLVALAFIPNPDNKPEIDHIDSNPLNNSVDNLRWVTHIENMNNPITKERLSSIDHHIQWTPEQKARARLSHLGKHHSDETKAKLSKSLKGNTKLIAALKEIRYYYDPSTNRRVYTH